MVRRYLAGALAAGMLVNAVPAKAADGPPRITSEPHTDAKARTIGEGARKLLGVPYNWGGRNDRDKPGLDAIGLVHVIMQEVHGMRDSATSHPG